METETNILYSTDHLDKIFTALSKAQGEFKVLEKNKDGFHGKYADLQSINDAPQQSLTKHGLCITQAHVGDRIKSVLGQSSGQHIIYETKFKDTASDKFKQASAWTFMKRYAILAMLNVSGTEDPERFGDDSVFVDDGGLTNDQSNLLTKGLETKTSQEFNKVYSDMQLDLKRMQKDDVSAYEYLEGLFKNHKINLKKEKK